jgi:tetratricopeptide repeat protein 30
LNHPYALCILQSLDPYDKKLHTDKWYYAKRWFLAVADMFGKHKLVTKDSSMEEILEFLEKAAVAGAHVQTVLGPHVSFCRPRIRLSM